MNIHDESKAFNCDVCFKIFSMKNDLKRHYRTHTGEKPFECKVCDKKFSRKATKKEVRSVECSICPEGRFLKTKSQLTNHMVFNYEPKFSCSHCKT